MRRGHDPQLADHNVVLGQRLDRRGVIGASCDRTQAREKFPRGKSLRQIIVRAHFEADDPVRLLAACGQHEDRHGGRRANPAQHFQSVDPRQHHIENHRVPHPGQRVVDTLEAVVDRDDVVAERLEIFHHEPAEFLVVIHHQDAARGVAFRRDSFARNGVHRSGQTLPVSSMSVCGIYLSLTIMPPVFIRA